MKRYCVQVRLYNETVIKPTAAFKMALPHILPPPPSLKPIKMAFKFICHSRRINVTEFFLVRRLLLAYLFAECMDQIAWRWIANEFKNNYWKMVCCGMQSQRKKNQVKINEVVLLGLASRLLLIHWVLHFNEILWIHRMFVSVHGKNGRWTMARCNLIGCFV